MKIFKKNFLTDSDGMNEKDYLLLISTIVFFTFITIGLTMLLFDKEIKPMYITLLEMVSPIVMTIIGSIFGVKAVEVFRNKSEKNEYKNEPIKDKKEKDMYM